MVLADLYRKEGREGLEGDSGTFWEVKTKHRQGGPYLKTGSSASGTSQRKTQQRPPIAPSPHRFVFLLEMWVFLFYPLAVVYMGQTAGAEAATFQASKVARNQ